VSSSRVDEGEKDDERERVERHRAVLFRFERAAAGARYLGASTCAA
jgi:hypothetical protein